MLMYSAQNEFAVAVGITRIESKLAGRLILRLTMKDCSSDTARRRCSFGGPGLAGTGQMLNSLKLDPPRHNALAAGVTKTAGGTLLAVGLATRACHS